MQNYRPFVAVFVLMASLAVADPMSGSGPIEGQLQGTFKLCSNAFEGNVLGDPKCRNVSYTLPPSYWQRYYAGGPFVHQDYPIVLFLSGNNMYRNEGTIDAILEQRCHPADGTPSLLSAANQATYCNPSFKLFDQDTILYNQMATGQIPEIIFLETSILSRYGGTRYDCSPIFGDHRTFLARDIPADAEQRFRTRQGRENWTLAGFSGGAGGALGVKLQDRDNRWGQLLLISPSNNDLTAMTVPDIFGQSEPALLNRFRATAQIPQTNLPVHKVSGPDETAESWGKFPLDGKFLAGSVLATCQTVRPDVTGTNMAIDGVTPIYTTNPLTGPSVGNYDVALWEEVKKKGLKQMVQRAGENLTDTVVVIARGNNKESLDPAAPVNVVIQSEVGDQPQLVNELTARGFLDAHIQTPGDHFTSPRYTFPAGMKKILELAGSKNGRPFVYNPTIENEHAPCAAQFPMGGS
jgi:hypothetical protein